jgi:hypothetical protein
VRHTLKRRFKDLETAKDAGLKLAHVTLAEYLEKIQ